MIEAPISIHEITTKINKGIYEDVDSFVNDFELMKENAQSYNEKGSEIYEDAERVKQIVLEKIEEWNAKHGDEGKEKYFEQVKKAELSVIDELVNYKQRGRKLSDLFMDIPSKDDYPDYHVVITSPMAFNDLRQEVEEGKLKDFDSFTERALLIFTNARAYNEEGSQVYQDSLVLEKQFNQRLEKVKSKIKMEKPAGYDEWIAKSGASSGGSVLKLKLKQQEKQSTPQTKVKLSLKKQQREEQQDVKEEASAEPTTVAAADEQSAMGVDDGTTNVLTGDVTMEEVEEEKKPRYVDENRTRAEGKTDADALIKSVSMTSIIPTSKAPQKALPAGTDLFQAIMPASKSRTVQSFAYHIPYYHHSVNVNVTLHESLNTRHHELIVQLNSRALSPIYSSHSSNWVDTENINNEKPIQSRYELRLAPGLNEVEIVANAAAARGLPTRQSTAHQYTNEESERYTIWINLGR
ncbi:hypothetical protein TRICI_000769 [Trichomonascus ciferrii]|uniref:Bromo domain-containing protein n=1 Tax=Trichomonascus ciferrii TaxID=44093 RepID=A0A642VBQ3_9ASCO|nr:hypothetical protein TRICI_000769 [Trichomonascus ciferrii]